MAKKVKGFKNNFMHIIGGTVLTEDIFLKNTRFIATICIIIVLYISNRYSCIEKMAEIESLQRELKDAKYESNTISVELVSVSREAKVKELVNKHGLQLERAKEPIYRIEN